MNTTQVFFSPDVLPHVSESVAFDSLKEYPLLLALALTLLCISPFILPKHGNASVKAPYSGSSISWLSRVRFFSSASDTVTEGYSKFKDRVFKLSGNDMLIIPATHVDELRNAPDTLVDAIKANTDNFQGVYSATSILNEGNLHNYVLQSKLTPKLSALVPIVRDELSYAIEKEFPECSDDWAQAQAFRLVINLISRLASRLFVGEELCRDEDWLAASRGYTENAFRSIIFLRLFPSYLKAFIAPFVIFTWKVTWHLRTARRLLIPLVLQRRVDKANGKRQNDLKFTNLLELMDENATGKDRDPERLARRTLILTLASSHTTSMAACQTLFDLCDRPEYIAELREEVKNAVDEDKGWHKTTLTKMRKLDSFMKESQRFHPPSLLGFKRAILQPLTLSNGQVLPKGAHTLMPIVPHQSEDPRLINPKEFDGLRYYKLRQQPENANRLQFATTDKYTLHFGHGKHACPGRFLASNTIKIILGQLLLDYDFKFPEGQGRPADVHAHEYIFPNPEGVVEFKERKNV